MKEWTFDEFANLFDHTLLRSDATKGDIKRLCEEALEYNFHAVFVNSYWTGYARDILSGTKVKVGVPVGFPLGASVSDVKTFECKKAVKDGAQEIDMVINIGALKDKEYDFVLEDINKVVEAASGRICKVIIETGYLNKEEKINACHIVRESKASFIKTSTGLFGSVATVEDIRLMRSIVGDNFGVKASGGIRSMKEVYALVEAGANRIGCSASVNIIREFVNERRKK